VMFWAASLDVLAATRRQREKFRMRSRYACRGDSASVGSPVRIERAKRRLKERMERANGRSEWKERFDLSNRRFQSPFPIAFPIALSNSPFPIRPFQSPFPIAVSDSPCWLPEAR